MAKALPLRAASTSASSRRAPSASSSLVGSVGTGTEFMAWNVGDAGASPRVVSFGGVSWPPSQMSTGVPHSCHDVGRTYVLASLRALHLDCDLPTARPGTYQEGGEGIEP